MEIHNDHPYKSKGKNRKGCGVIQDDGSTCDLAKTHRHHLGIPLSLNVIGSRGGNHTYNSFKKAWEQALLDELSRSGLPAGWKRDEDVKIDCITAEGMICFPVMRKDRDQGNFRWFLEKCLGDALQAGGYIIDDSYWPDRHYEFGGLEMTCEPGVAFTRLMLFPR